MRSILVICALASALPPSLAGQEAKKPTPFVLAAGPSWDFYNTGIRLRGEYHLIRDRWFGLQLEAGTRWTPTQSFFSRYSWDQNGSPSYWGWSQAVDFRLGAAATLSPFPRGPFSPYVLASVAAVQTWRSGETYYRGFDGSVRRSDGATWGDILVGVGLGLRTRLGGRSFRLELRSGGGIAKDLTLGTTLPF